MALSQQKITEEFIEKTRLEIRNNIARREREAFGEGILWSTVIMAVTFTGVYLTGYTPNFGSLTGIGVVGLYYKYRKGN